MLADCPDVRIQRYIFLCSSPIESHKSLPERSTKGQLLLAGSPHWHQTTCRSVASSRIRDNGDGNDLTARDFRRQYPDQACTGRTNRVFFRSDGSSLRRSKKTYRLDGEELNRGGGPPSGGLIESLAPSVDVPVRIELSHLDDSCSRQ